MTGTVLPTRGKFFAGENSEDSEVVYCEDGVEVYPIASCDTTGDIPYAEENANAAFIADAFNVYSECGLTPRQLESERSALANRVATLEAQLSEYGQHKYDCKLRPNWNKEPCSCGLAEARALLANSKEFPNDR